MSPSYDKHLAEDLLERYSLGSLAPQDVARVEEHVLVCQDCQERLESTDSWVRALRHVGPKLRPERAKIWDFLLRPRLVPALAGAAILLFAAGLVLENRNGAPAPFAIALQATRGENPVPVPAHQPLRLQPAMEGLPQFSEYRLEIVDQFGKKIREATLAASQTGTPAAVVKGVSPGVYFVRLYTPAGDLLREYALPVGGPR